MRLVKLVATISLLLFVGATVGVLIAQEVSRPASEPTGVPLSSDSPGAADAVAAVTTSTQSAIADVTNAQAQAPEDPAASDSTDIESDEPTTGTETSEAQSDCVVDAIYFHNTLRCHTCKTIEATARAVLEAEFSEEFAAGQLRWSAINMEDEWHYVEEFDLVTPTLILVRSVGGERVDWVALDKTWSLIGSEVRFRDYVESETRVFLGGCL